MKCNILCVHHFILHVQILPILQNSASHIRSLETLGSPLAFKIKLFWSEQCLDAQREFV